MPKTSRPRINVFNLIIETTRRCNMTCELCLRGNAQGKDMLRSHVLEVLKHIDHIGQVTFTGGEPCLNLDIIRYFYTVAKRMDKTPDSFYVATNGTTNQPELAHILLEAYAEAECKEMCGVSLSIDAFHTGLPQSMYLKGLAFYAPDKEHPDGDPNEWILSRGRAEEYGLGNVDRDYTRKFTCELSTWPDGDEELTVDTVYLSANGFVYPECDLPYAVLDDNQNLHITQLRPYLYEAATGQIREDIIKIV